MALLPEYPDWKCDSPNTSHKPANKMDCAEPLIAEYDLKDWMNPMYSYDIHTDVTKLCRPALKMGYKGILRVNPTSKNGA